MRNDKLKPCPFCGGEAMMHTTGDGDGYRVACKRILGCGAKFEWFDREEEAIEAWNNRATEAEIRNKAISEFAKRVRHKIMSEIDECADELEWITEIEWQLKEE